MLATAAAQPCLVLDVETAPDNFARLLTTRRTASVPRGSPLCEVVNVSTLEFGRAADGSCGGFALRSFHRDEYAEQDILGNAEAALARVADGGLLATFNGRAFDLPVLRMRQIRWWQFAASAIDAVAAGGAEHVDLMQDLSMDGAARWASLEDACASVGFSLRGPSGVGRGQDLPREMQRCEIDVVGTAILLLHVMARRGRSAVPLVRGLPALGDMLRRAHSGRRHLDRFAESDLLRQDAVARGAQAAWARRED